MAEFFFLVWLFCFIVCFLFFIVFYYILLFFIVFIVFIVLTFFLCVFIDYFCLVLKVLFAIVLFFISCFLLFWNEILQKHSIYKLLKLLHSFVCRWVTPRLPPTVCSVSQAKLGTRKSGCTSFRGGTFMTLVNQSWDMKF